jgi:glycosyltransferase involved in cell wall biosynthesis
MRVLLIAPPRLPVPPVSYGGTEAVLDRLACGIVRAGHDVVLYTTGDSTCPVERRWLYERAQGLEAEDEVELRHVRHAYDLAAEFDVVHDHTFLGPSHLRDRLVETPVVVTNHGSFDEGVCRRLSAVGGRVSLVAISHAQARTAPADLRIAAVIHHGIDVDSFPFGARPGDYSLFLGRMSPAKGVHRAIAVAHAAGERLVVAAKMREPEERRYFEERVQPMLGGLVTFVGEVGGREKLELLAGARALINPITWPEPFGLVMLEALACGTPVLAFPCGAAPEIVQHGVTGFLCADETEMVRRLQDVDRLARAACRRSVSVSFSTERMVADHLRLYASVLADSVPAVPARVSVAERVSRRAASRARAARREAPSAVGPCPDCASPGLRAVFDGYDTNFHCESCGACWFQSMGWLGRVDPSTCPGCSAEQLRECRGRVAALGAAPRARE